MTMDALQGNFAALVDAIVQASLNGHPVAKEQIGQLGATPALLQSLGLPDLPLGIKGKVIEKVVMDHGIPKSMVKRLAGIVAAPQAVYNSAPPHPAGVVVITVEVTGLGQVMLSIASAQSVGRSHIMNLVTSIYAKEDVRAFARWEAEGLLLWRGVLREGKAI
jgi:Phage MuF-C-terminal domain